MYKVYKMQDGKQIDVSGYGMSLSEANAFLKKCRADYPENQYVVMAA